MGEFVEIIDSLNHKLKALATDTRNMEFIKHTDLGTRRISGAVKKAKQLANSSVIVEMADQLIPSYAATFIKDWEIQEKCASCAVEHCEALLACLICACKKNFDGFDKSAILAMLKETGVDLMVRSVCLLLLCTL